MRPTALALLSAPPVLLANSLSVPGAASRCSCRPCACGGGGGGPSPGRSSPALASRRGASVRADAASSPYAADFRPGLRMAADPPSLSAQWARIVASSSASADEALERRLLGLDSAAAAAASVAPDPSHRESSTLTSQPPPLYPSSRLILVAAGVLSLASAIGLTLYLWGGIAGAASATAIAVNVPAAPAKFEGLTRLLLRGGGAGYATGMVSVGLLGLRDQISCIFAARYLLEKVLPSAFKITKKMLVMEAWRQVWILLFGEMRKGWNVLARGTANSWKEYVPPWIRFGLRGMFKSHVQRVVHAALGQWFSHMWSGAKSFQIEGGSCAATENIVLEAMTDTSAAVEAAVEGASA